MTKRQINDAARMIIYGLIKSVDSFAFSECSGMSENDKDAIIEKIHSIAETVNGRRATNIGSTTEIINHVVKP